MTKVNGTTQETSHGHKECFHVHQPIRMGATPGTSETDGDEQSGAYIRNSDRENPHRVSLGGDSGDANTGKLIERIQLLQQEYEVGLASDIAILDALLKTMMERKKKFDASVKELKQDIQNSLIQEDK